MDAAIVSEIMSATAIGVGIILAAAGLGSALGWGLICSKFIEGIARQKDVQASCLDEIGIVFVTPDVAIRKTRTEWTGMTDAEGKPLPSFKSLDAQVYVKRNGKWLRTAAFYRPIEE